MMAETVLVVDDEESIREILTTWLEDSGYETVTSSNGIEALRELYQHRPDLVIADILMPEMDGYEFCRLAREVSEAPIMLLTALSKEHEKVKGFDLTWVDPTTGEERDSMMGFEGTVADALVHVGLEEPKRYRGEITPDTTKGPADQQRRRRAIDETNEESRETAHPPNSPTRCPSSPER
ncbi:MAG: response regulator [Gemmatimonadetes bacterium]|nr:response regulator [Gemmatimonadota bacterium]